MGTDWNRGLLALRPLESNGDSLVSSGLSRSFRAAGNGKIGNSTVGCPGRWKCWDQRCIGSVGYNPNYCNIPFIRIGEITHLVTNLLLNSNGTSHRSDHGFSRMFPSLGPKFFQLQAGRLFMESYNECPKRYVDTGCRSLRWFGAFEIFEIWDVLFDIMYICKPCMCVYIYIYVFWMNRTVCMDGYVIYDMFLLFVYIYIHSIVTWFTCSIS